MRKHSCRMAPGNWQLVRDHGDVAKTFDGITELDATRRNARRWRIHDDEAFCCPRRLSRTVRHRIIFHNSLEMQPPTTGYRFETIRSNPRSDFIAMVTRHTLAWVCRSTAQDRRRGDYVVDASLPARHGKHPPKASQSDQAILAGISNPFTSLFGLS